MYFLLLGIAAFVLFFLYDWNSVRHRSPLLHGCFFAGCLLLCGATLWALILAWPPPQWTIARLSLLAAAAFFFLLLIYTLFFALPFQQTYVDTSQRPRVYTGGMYALCRHPGVVWFFCFYLCLGLALRPAPLLWQGMVFSLCNLLYVIFQDRWTFPRLLEGYEVYRRETPFLLPNLRSLSAALSRERR